MLPATKRYYDRGDIRNEETSFNPLPGKDKTRTLKQFGKLMSCLFAETYTALLFICWDIHCITVYLLRHTLHCCLFAETYTALLFICWDTHCIAVYLLRHTLHYCLFAIHCITNSFRKHVLKKSDTLAQGSELRSFTKLSYYHYFSLYMMYTKYTQAILYTWLYVLLFTHSVYWVSCCSHADQILPTVPAPHERMSRTDLGKQLLCGIHLPHYTV
jgi:hypothetical protein